MNGVYLGKKMVSYMLKYKARNQGKCKRETQEHYKRNFHLARLPRLRESPLYPQTFDILSTLLRVTFKKLETGYRRDGNFQDLRDAVMTCPRRKIVEFDYI